MELMSQKPICLSHTLQIIPDAVLMKGKKLQISTIIILRFGKRISHAITLSRILQEKKVDQAHKKFKPLFKKMLNDLRSREK